ncbi:PilN domain-containing protein [Halioxenophilus sp. WMMB6]|uniref:PilN domain-containing protein n=1 Tax=Halioxenophilus sp. WMMB6 TaxID=3073815 RepID=UPI00295EB581|nr:PilN domain-containing protein [Halioxenophilus sp. WMMB6]
MAKINLLPWRDELRAEKKKEFYTILAGVAILGGLVAFAWISMVNGQIESQKVRNDMLNREIAQLNKKVAEIKALKKKRADLIERMEVIQNLQGNRPQIVRVFDDLVRKIPDGVYLTELNRKGKQISFSGIAESNNRVSSLMRQLDESPWFEKPNLLSVTKTRNGGGDDDYNPNRFNMTVLIETPKADDDKDGA